MLDVIVIGGGPGGATTASLLAKDGRSVLLLEREHFPRYHVGESLLPATVHGVCRTLGVEDDLRDAGFTLKRGGSFRWGSNPGIWTFAFGDQMAVPGADYAYQVERSRFDEILLRNASRLGVDVREGCKVERVLRGNRFEGVEYTDESGTLHQVRARYIVDSSGSAGVLANQIGHRRYDEHFRNIALFGYFAGGGRLPPPNEGNIFTAAFDEGWFWYIPLRPDLTSVGAVLPKERVSALRHGSPSKALERLIHQCPAIADLLGTAPLVERGPYAQVRLVRDFSYTNDRFYADGGVLVGDAACFIDPVFSSGVHLATLSGTLAARSINTSLEGTLPESEAFREFERRYRREFGVFYQFLLAFYEIHRAPESYFWSARKLVRAATSDRDAFTRLVSGLSSAEPRFASADAYIASTAEKSRLLEAATQLDDSWSKRDPELAGRASEHLEALGRERIGLLTDDQAATFADGLITSPCGLRWIRR